MNIVIPACQVKGLDWQLHRNFSAPNNYLIFRGADVASVKQRLESRAYSCSPYQRPSAICETRSAVHESTPTDETGVAGGYPREQLP